MTKTEKALAAAVLEICKLNKEVRQMNEELAKVAMKLAAAQAKIPVMQFTTPEHPNCRCSLDPFVERSARYETQ